MRRVLEILFVSLLVLTFIISCSQKKLQSNLQPAGHEIKWITDLDSALTLAANTNKPIMIDFMADWCPPCKRMEDSTFSDKRVIDKAKSFITVRIDVDKNQDIANKYNSNANKYGGIGIPNMLFLDKNQKTIKHPIGFLDPENMIAYMDSVLNITKNDNTTKANDK